MREGGYTVNEAVEKVMELHGIKLDSETVRYLILEVRNPGGGPRDIRYTLKKGFSREHATSEYEVYDKDYGHLFDLLNDLMEEGKIECVPFGNFEKRYDIIGNEDDWHRPTILTMEATKPEIYSFNPANLEKAMEGTGLDKSYRLYEYGEWEIDDLIKKAIAKVGELEPGDWVPVPDLYGGKDVGQMMNYLGRTEEGEYHLFDGYRPGYPGYVVTCPECGKFFSTRDLRPNLCTICEFRARNGRWETIKFKMDEEEINVFEGDPFHAAIVKTAENVSGWDRYDVDERQEINGVQFYWGTLDDEDRETVYTFYMVIAANGKSVEMEIDKA